MRFGVGEGINQLFSNFLGKTLACFKRKSYLCFIKRNINNIGIMKQVDFSNFTPQEQREYEASKMAYRDIKNSIDTAKREGKEEGLAEGMEKGLAEGMEKGMNKRSLEIARKMLANGMDAATVMEIMGLSESQLQQLKG
mgnify:CR=1 FL=1